MLLLKIINENNYVAYIILFLIFILIGGFIYFSIRKERSEVDKIKRKLAKERLKRIKKCQKKQ